MYVFCLDCDCEITFDTLPSTGDRVACPQCQTLMEVINTEPIQLDWTYQKQSESFWSSGQPNNNWTDDPYQPVYGT